jgi:hypothetical protein
LSLLVTFEGKAPFRTINGGAFCLWKYRIADQPSDEGFVAKVEGLLGQLGLGTSGAAGSVRLAGTTVPGAAVGLGFSKRLDIKDPSQYPDVAEVKGTRLEKLAGADLQFVFVGGAQPSTGAITIQFIAPCTEDPFTPVALAAIDAQGSHQTPPFRVSPQGFDNTVQAMRGPAVVCGDSSTGTGGPTIADFVGTLPYASEVFGVYQPLAGWLGHQTTKRLSRFTPAGGTSARVERLSSNAFARTSSGPVVQVGSTQLAGVSRGVLSPVGLVTLFREYFFEFDNFLGAPSGHIWISPGGTVEVVESSTRRTLIEKTAAQSEEETSKVEETLTSLDDVADAVKEDNANDTKLGASASAGAKFAGIQQADASASFSNQTTTHKSSEVTHKHTRTQSSRVRSEIHRNFKTTFKTVTETTDVTSRRYVVQNTTSQLVNYELRRKMRKVGVQVQHIGTRLSWQVFLDNPGKGLGLGELVHVVAAPDLSSLKKPEPPPPFSRRTPNLPPRSPCSAIPAPRTTRTRMPITCAAPKLPAS